VTDATADYRTESDVVGSFLNERCNQGSSDALFCPSAELLKAFNAYAKEQGEGELSAKAFANRMSGRGIRKVRTKASKRWLGVDITPEYREELRQKGVLHG
jgi:phage/plasmid-associated DNA primase